MEQEIGTAIKAPVAPVETGAQCLMLAESNTPTFKEGGSIGVFLDSRFRGNDEEEKRE